MKSGIRSIGLSAYAATARARAFAYHGTRGSRAARYTATTARLSSRARARSRARRVDSGGADTGILVSKRYAHTRAEARGRQHAADDEGQRLLRLGTRAGGTHMGAR